MADPRANPVRTPVAVQRRTRWGRDANSGRQRRRCGDIGNCWLPSSAVFVGAPGLSARFGPPRCTDRCRIARSISNDRLRRSFVQFVRPTVGVSRSVECWQRQPLIVSKSAAFGSNISVPSDGPLTGPMSETGQVWPVGSSSRFHSIDNCSPPIPNSVTKRVYRPPCSRVISRSLAGNAVVRSRTRHELSRYGHRAIRRNRHFNHRGDSDRNRLVS